MTSVFVSYSRKDRTFAVKFTESLNKSDLETWIDWDDIPPTADWLDQIHRGIERSDGFLFLLSPDSIKSKVCRQEIDHAVQNGKRLIPIVVRDVDPSTVHPALAKVNWIYSRKQDDFDVSIEKTLQAIRTDLSWVEFHRRLQVRALEWESRKDSSLLLRGRDLQEAEEQLASLGQKEPHPTDLQRQYTLASRRRESRTRNLILTIGVMILIALSLLSVFANSQRILAQNNEGTAIANAYIAETEKANSKNQEATAVANANLALARQLAAQSQLLAAESGTDLLQSGLLAVESLRRYPTLEGDQALRRIWPYFPELISSMKHEGELEPEVLKIVFSPDGNLLASASTDGTIRVWNPFNGQEISRFEADGGTSNITFSHDSNALIANSGNFVYIWEVTTGNEVNKFVHDDSVGDFVISVDGDTLVSSSSNGTVRVWNINSEQQLSQISHNGIVWDIALSSDEKYVASGGNDGGHIWEVITGNEVARINPSRRIFSVAYSPDGQYVAFAGEGVSQVIEVGTWKEISQIRQEGNVGDITFSPDGEWIASGSTDGTLLIWEAVTGTEIARSMHDWSAGNDPIMGSVSSLEFSPSGKLILSGSFDGTGRIWDSKTGDEITRLAEDTYYSAEDVIDSFVTTIAFSPDGKLAALGNSKGWVYVWLVDPSMEIFRFDRGTNSRSGISFNTDGTKIAFGGTDEDIQIWDLTTDTQEGIVPGQESNVVTISYSFDGNYIYTKHMGGLARVWDVSTSREIASIGYLNAVAFSPVRHWIASDMEGDFVEIWDVINDDVIARIPTSDYVSSLTFSPDGNWIAVLTGGDEVGIWESATGKKISQIAPSDYISEIAFNPDGNWIVSGGEDGFARIWETTTGNEIAKVEHDTIVHTVAFSPDGKYMVSGSGEFYPFGSISFDGRPLITHGTMIIWDAVSQKENARITFDSDRFSFEFSKDGNWVASYGHRNTVRIWNTATGVELGRITHGEGFQYINSIGFSPNGKWIVTGGSDGQLKTWLWRPNDMIDNICARLPRNLSLSEWNFYIGNESYRATCDNLPVDLELSLTPSP